MRRADRLFQILQILQRRRLTTAAKLADRLGVSPRTIYRDLRDLSLSGVPIEGEAGVGYRLGKDFELPPLMFDLEEIQALVLGARMVETWADSQMQRAAQSALEKVEAALPPKHRHRMHETAMYAPSLEHSHTSKTHLATLRAAIDTRSKVELTYMDKQGNDSRRGVVPLGLYFWGGVWTLGSWCELRAHYRNFRIDRILSIEVQSEKYPARSPFLLEDYLRAMQGDH